MNAWSKNPPTHDEWMAAKSDGFWWVKFLMMPASEEVDEETGETLRWPDLWHTDLVQITDEMVSGKSILDDGRLTARGFILKQFYLDDAEATQDFYWQPVNTPDDIYEETEPQC